MQKGNKRNLIFNSFIIICSISLIVMIMVFGITFGTLFVGGLCFTLVIIRIINHIYFIYRGNKTIMYIRNSANVIFLLFIISFLVIEVLIIKEVYTIEQPDVNMDYVVILGAGLKGEEVSKRLEKRLIRGVEYLSNNLESKVVVSGGQGDDEDISEAEAMGKYLIEKGINSDRIYYEDKSTSTVENLSYSKQIIYDDSIKVNPKVLVITSDYHMFRAKMISNKLGLQSHGFTSESELSVKLNYLLREYFVVVKDWLTFVIW